MTLHVTDHAVLRFLELVLEFDIQQVRHRILNICHDAAKAGASSVTKDGFVYKFSPGGTHVVTVTPDKPHPNKKGRK